MPTIGLFTTVPAAMGSPGSDAAGAAGGAAAAAGPADSAGPGAARTGTGRGQGRLWRPVTGAGRRAADAQLHPVLLELELGDVLLLEDPKDLLEVGDVHAHSLDGEVGRISMNA